MTTKTHWFVDSRYIAIGENYELNMLRAIEANKNQSADAFKSLCMAHGLLMGLIGRMLEQHSNKPVFGDESIGRRFVLTAAFIQGILICRQAVLGSTYLQAGTLLRQEYECLGLLREVKEGKRRDGKQVNAKNAPWNGSKHYGELSALAHLSDHEIISSIIGENTGWGDFSSTVPQYNAANTKRLYGLHVALVLDLVYQLHSLYSDMYEYEMEESEQDAITSVIGILEESDVWKR